MKVIDLKNTAPKEAIAEAVAVLKNGGLVIFPTETVYGAGVDATNQTAADKLLQYKSRREGKPLSIAVANQAMAEEYVELNEQARTLYQQFMPGPITIVSKDLGKLAKGVASEFATVGTRIADYDLVRGLARAFGKPFTATSANSSGKKRPYSVQDLLDNLSDRQKSLIDLILDAGQLPPNPPSTVIDTTLSTPVTLRSGKIDLGITGAQNGSNNQGKNSTQLVSSSETETQQIAGRLLLKHWDTINQSGLILGLDGPLGAGKTIFAKGVAKFLGIKEKITSPTYSYINEYKFTRHQTTGIFYHLDLWKVETPDEFERLELHKLFAPNNIILIEWYSQVQSELEQIANKHKIPIVPIAINEINEVSEVSDGKRQIIILE